MIVSSGPHEAPRGALGLSQSVTNGPPRIDTFFQDVSRCDANPTHAPSGEKKGVSAPSIPPRPRVPSSEATGRTNSSLPMPAPAVYTMRDPSGEIATWCWGSVPKNSPSGAVLTTARETGRTGSGVTNQTVRTVRAAVDERDRRDACRALPEGGRRDGRHDHLVGGGHDPIECTVQRQPHVTDVADTLPRVLFEATPEIAVHAGWDALGQGAPIRVALEHLGERERDIFTGEHVRARQHLVEDDAERPDVGSLVHLLPARLLRRHVGRRPP